MVGNMVVMAMENTRGMDMDMDCTAITILTITVSQYFALIFCLYHFFLTDYDWEHPYYGYGYNGHYYY